jgi:hypothetical protein
VTTTEGTENHRWWVATEGTENHRWWVATEGTENHRWWVATEGTETIDGGPPPKAPKRPMVAGT